ncbi:TPA: hypothetical protein QHC28_001230 [Aeromonas veronii bv. veronii]|nr:hypothetical protein [Aeromonas veronii bv. veronii]
MSLSPYQIERLTACQVRIQKLRQELNNSKDMNAEQLRLASFHLADRVDEMFGILLHSQPSAE